MADKTGTLTYGTPEVTEVVSVSKYSNDEIYAYAAAAEKMSEHPLGKVIVRCYGKETATGTDFYMIPRSRTERRRTSQAASRSDV